MHDVSYFCEFVVDCHLNHLIKHLYNLYLWKQKKKHKILLPLRGTQYLNNNESTLIQHDVESVLIHCCCVDSLCLPTEPILLGLKKHPSPLFLSSLFVVPLSLLKQQGIKNVGNKYSLSCAYRHHYTGVIVTEHF